MGRFVSLTQGPVRKKGERRRGKVDTEDIQMSKRERKASKRITRKSFPERKDTVREKRPKGVWGVA